jgi:adenylate cyclase
VTNDDNAKSYRFKGSLGFDPLTPAEYIRQQLSRVLSSPEFKATDAQKTFLKFIVEAVLSGRSNEIKGYTVATQVFGRAEDFNQATDPIVSIQANKRRRALERYYLVAG